MRETRFRDLVTERGWARYETFDVKFGLARDALAGREREPGLCRIFVAQRTFERWMAGDIKSLPRPQTRRVLEHLLGEPAKSLFAPPTDDGASSGVRIPPADGAADTLTTPGDPKERGLDMHRRQALSTAAYSLAAVAVPAPPERPRSPAGGRHVGRRDLEALRETTATFSRIDQRYGGGHARGAVVQYLAADVTALLSGRFADDSVRRAAFSAAAELAYLCGWMAFDDAEHATAAFYFEKATRLAAEADDAPLTGHVLRAMAHQAIDLGDRPRALALADASIDTGRYASATPRERALLGVVHARALAVNDRPKAAAAALVRAERDLDDARPDLPEPDRVFFFGEAGLAHETACALRELGDMRGAVREFDRSVRTRKATAFTRTHAVTLGYLGAAHAARGDVEHACAVWSQALDAMGGIRSARTRATAVDMHRTLGRLPTVAAARELHSRVTAHLARTA
ncbi:Tat pathway signal protein (plasmid) [Embleya sp. NBC_00888]|uniref:Tat pathway signal protein n=1 Tax=Embleya sp. NBC_00888 TaxID=2975960 RepID=UPI00386E1882|nr:Tat pathway signal protein [Embleya sp. NBC_00888]